jgi:hypothetical protein
MRQQFPNLAAGERPREDDYGRRLLLTLPRDPRLAVQAEDDGELAIGQFEEDAA